MATRMQQRRGTAAQWTSANPVLAAGEIGFEIDTYKFKIGDGINQWGDLDYFGASDDVLASLINGAPETLDTLGEIANALGNSPDFANTVLDHVGATSNVHGIANTLALSTITDVQNAQTAAQSYTDSELTAHNLLTENVHGIANTLVLATKDYVANAAGSGLQWNAIDEQFDLDSTIATEEYTTNAVADHNALTENVHGIANTLVLATQTDVSNAQTAAQSYADSLAVNYDPAGSAANAEAYTDSQIDAHVAITTNVHGIADTTKLVTTDAASQTIGGDLILTGNLTVQGNTTTVSAQDLFVTDPLIYLASEQYDNDALDIGFTGAYGTTGGNSEVHLHLGLVRDVSDSNKWKLFSNVPHPEGNEVNFTNAVYETLKLGTLEPTVGVAFSDGTQSKEGVPSRTTIHQKTDSYTLSSLNERDDLIEINKATGTTLTIPTDATLNFPIGTSIDILQTGAGQVTIAGAGGVTVNATPGLKLRAQWSSATLFKRAADTWVVFGDLSA